MDVPLLDLKLQYAPLKKAILAAMANVADSQVLVLGPKADAFERAVAEYCGAPHAIGVSSGTDAELMLLMALGLGLGDVVVTSPYTFSAASGLAKHHIYNRFIVRTPQRAAREKLALPIFPELSEEQQRTVVASVAEFVREN